MSPSPRGSLSPRADGSDAIRAARGEKLAMVVARLIAQDVARRGLTAGSALATEQAMAAEFGVGRPSVREALRLLEAQGLVQIRPGQGGGPIVAEPSPESLGQTISLFMQMQGVTIGDALQAHVRINGLDAAMAAERVAEGHTEGLDELRRASRSDLLSARTDDLFIRTGSGFHAIIRAIAGNSTIGLLTGALAHVYRVNAERAHQGHWDADQRQHVAEQHVAIERAIRRGQPERARRLNEDHLRDEIEHLSKTAPGVLDQPVTWT